jgi:hypothetical protein
VSSSAPGRPGRDGNGAWTFEFRDGDALVASKTFTVTAAPGAAGQPECMPAAVP